MKWTAVLYWGMRGAFAGLGFYALFKAVYFLWSATGPLIHTDLQHDYFLRSGLWFAVFLMCGGGVAWLLNRGHDEKDRFLTDEEETQ